MQIKRRIAAAALALALAVGGIVGISTQDLDGTDDQVTEQAGRASSAAMRWSNGGASTYGSTWS